MLEGHVIYQWESRHNIELKWQPAQRRQWTDEEGNDVSDPRTSEKPTYKPLVITDVTDTEGWIYAFDFAGIQGNHTEKMMGIEEATDFVRRRSWAPERSEAHYTPPPAPTPSTPIVCDLCISRLGLPSILRREKPISS